MGAGHPGASQAVQLSKQETEALDLEEGEEIVIAWRAWHWSHTPQRKTPPWNDYWKPNSTRLQPFDAEGSLVLTNRRLLFASHPHWEAPIRVVSELSVRLEDIRQLAGLLADLRVNGMAFRVNEVSCASVAVEIKFALGTRSQELVELQEGTEGVHSLPPGEAELVGVGVSTEWASCPHCNSLNPVATPRCATCGASLGPGD